MLRTLYSVAWNWQRLLTAISPQNAPIIIISSILLSPSKRKLTLQCRNNKAVHAQSDPPLARLLGLAKLRREGAEIPLAIKVVTHGSNARACEGRTVLFVKNQTLVGWFALLCLLFAASLTHTCYHPNPPL